MDKGEELVKYFGSSPGFHRGFCGVCGSPIVNRPAPSWRLASLHPSSTSELGVPLGVPDDDPRVGPECHCFVGSKATWFEITDRLPQYAEYPPGA